VDVNIEFKINKKSTFPFLIRMYFSNIHILNHRIIAASFVEKGSQSVLRLSKNQVNSLMIFFAVWVLPQFASSCNNGSSDLPALVKEYSTLGGISVNSIL
jgi:hypothetical protein